MTSDLEIKAFATPEAIFKEPDDVTKSVRFTTEDKIKILESWRENEEALVRAGGEGLDGGERPHLRAVLKELDRLKAKENR